MFVFKITVRAIVKQRLKLEKWLNTKFVMIYITELHSKIILCKKGFKITNRKKTIQTTLK